MSKKTTCFENLLGFVVKYENGVCMRVLWFVFDMYGLMCLMEFKRLCFLWVVAFQLIHLVSGMGVFLGANINRDDDQLMFREKEKKQL